MQLSEAMDKIIERIYKIFDRYPVPQQFNLCMPCCVSPQEEKALRQTSLRELPFALLHTYVHGSIGQEINSSEIRYILPRLLEFIAHKEYPGISEEICLKRVGLSGIENWLPAEQAVLADFARQYLVDLLTEAQSAGRLLRLDEVLIMFHMAGVDITPLLDAVLEQPGFWALASLAFMLHMKRTNGCLNNSFLNDKDANSDLLNQRINEWVKHSASQLSALAEQAIISPADLTEHDQRYWIEESLCALYDSP